MKKSCPIKTTRKERFRRLRLHKRRRRLIRLRKRSLRINRESEALAKRFGTHSKILKILEQNATKKIHVKQAIRITLPKTFSIISDPKLVIETINQFAAVKTSGGRPTQVYIDHSALESYDLAASALLDVVAVELKNELRINNKLAQFRGKLPKDREVSRFIKAIGIIKHLGIKTHLPTSAEMQKLKVFDRRSRHYSRPINAKTASRKERAASGFVEHINECLSAGIKKVFTEKGVTQLSGCIGELLDNAEEHAEFSDWSMLGYLDLDRNEPKVEIAIFNFGRSIAQTFLELPASHFAWQEVRPYLDRHLGLKSFVNHYRQEDLITVMALQEHISSKNTGDEEETRGHGTIQLLRFFKNVHHLCTNSSEGAEMALLSGSTFIRFDGSQMLTLSANEKKTIAFNEENSLDYLPSSKYVKGLGKTRFPGTIFSIRFPLTPAMVQEE